MSRYRRLVAEHVKERLVDDHTTCDVCGRRSQGPGPDAWEVGGWDWSEVTIEAKLGAIYPEGGDCRTGYRLDVCPTCFSDKVQPLIERELGVRFHEYETDDFAGFYQDAPQADR